MNTTDLKSIEYIISQFTTPPTFNNVNFGGMVRVNDENICIITSLIDSEIFETDGEITLNQDIRITFDANYLSEINPQVVVSYEQYYRDLLNNKITSDTPILEELSEQKFGKQLNRRDNLQKITDFIAVLKKSFYLNESYPDTVVIFSSKALEMSIPDYNNLILKESSIKAVDEFLEWFASNDLQELDKKKQEVAANILSKELCVPDIEERFNELLKQLPKLTEECKKTFDLYLDDFTYSKFSKKLEETALGFYEKLNGVLTNVRNQVLSLPLLLVLIRSKLVQTNNDINTVIAICFITYTSIILAFLIQQAFYLNSINEEFQRFYNKNKEVSALKEDISFMNNAFNKQKCIQWIIFSVLMLITIGILIYFLYQIFPSLFQICTDNKISTGKQ